MQLTKIIIATSVLFIFSFLNVSAQTSPEIERLTAKIAKNPKLDSLYIERGILYTWKGKFIGENVEYSLIGSTIDENRLKALADAEAALKINPKNYKAYLIRGLVKDPKTNFETAAKLKSESNIIGNIYQADYSTGKIVDSSELIKTVPKAVVVKGDERTATIFDSLLFAKEFSRKNSQANVIMFNKKTKKYSLHEAIITENIPINLQLAETPFRKALKDKSIIPTTYESLKINHEYSLQLLPKEKELGQYNYTVEWEVADIVDVEGLSLIKNNNIQLMRGSKGVRLLFDSELEKSNFDEAVKIYQWLEKINLNSNDLDVVKVNRKTNLAKMFRASDKLKPLIEAEMVKWKYTEEEKATIRGTKI